MEPNNNEKRISIKDEILHKIDTQEVSMRSRKHFVLQAAVLIFLAVVVLVLSAFIFNFISFNLRINEHGYLLSFGPQGIWVFLKVFPWIWLAVDLILLSSLERMLRTFRFGYQIPVLYLLLALVLVAALIGFGVDRDTPLNERLEHQANIHNLPEPFNNLYSNFRQQPPANRGACDCVVTSINDGLITAYEKNDPDKTVVLVLRPDDASLPNLAVGSHVLVGGDFHDGVLQVFGLRILPQ